MFYARMYKNTFTNTFQTMTSVDKSKGIVKSAKKNLNWSKKKFEKKFLAQNSIINVDYENISDFVFTRIFFFNFWKNYKSQTWNCSVVCLRQVIFGGNLLNSHAIQLGNPCASYTTWGVPEIFSWTKTDCGNTFLKNVVIHGEKQWREWAMDRKTTHINL